MVVGHWSEEATNFNKMVSLGDTAISFNILQPPLGRGGGVLESQNPKCQDLPKFNFRGGGGVSGTKSQNRGVLENLVKNFWKPNLEAKLAGASQIVSHILRMWRLKHLITARQTEI